MREGDEAKLSRLRRFERRADLVVGARETVRLAEEARREARQAVAHRIVAEVHLRQHDRGRRPVVAAALADQHRRAVGGKGQLGERAGKAAARLDQRHQAARGHVDALQHALDVMPHLAHEPVVGVSGEKIVVVEHGLRVALGAEDDEAERRLVEAQMQDGIVELARHRQRPEVGAEVVDLLQ